ncbi:hypothetical protein AGMMS4957_08540 [Bacteroidia bacterium]|nr:hypothetical protein AGMMS4957_08540 [Bacteroidia bacterium]
MGAYEHQTNIYKPTITTTTLPNGVIGQPYTATLAATAYPLPITWRTNSGSPLPSGLVLNTSTGVISGTPTATANAYSFYMMAENCEYLGYSTQLLSITITDGSGAVPPPPLPPPDVPTPEPEPIIPIDQTIMWNPMPLTAIEGDTLVLVGGNAAVAGSGLPVRYKSLDPRVAIVSGDTIFFVASGAVAIRASQAGNEYYNAASPVDKTWVVESISVDVATLDVSNADKTAEDTYLARCGSEKMLVMTVTPENPVAKVVYAGTTGNTFAVDISRPGIHTVTYTVVSAKKTADYTFTVERRIPFDDIVSVKYDNLLIINNNPDHNGGYNFVGYEWFKDGVSIGTRQTYSAGDKPTDRLDPNAEYSVVLVTDAGDTLRVCPGSARSPRTTTLRAYPNPTERGTRVTVSGIPTGATTVEIFDIVGRLISTHRVDGARDGSDAVYHVSTPTMRGTYLIKAGNETVKIVVK